ncbi:hypothetical protein BHE74_00056020 [Ensete ventricosum]|nr:hypothetical protein BHE74_00056020 [Ensete ventricosum]
MYSLICRHAKVSAIPNQQAEDDELSACKAKLPNKNTRRAKKVIEALENSSWAKTILLSLTLFGTCMVIGDGILTPCISAAYLSNFPDHVADAFYKSTPGELPLIFHQRRLQAMISATFAIVKQSMALGCFPRVRVVHTSHKHGGQVYIPEINFLLMFACFMVTASFRETSKIGNAYGNAFRPSVLDLPWTNCCFRAPQGSRWSR